MSFFRKQTDQQQIFQLDDECYYDGDQGSTFDGTVPMTMSAGMSYSGGQAVSGGTHKGGHKSVYDYAVPAALTQRAATTQLIAPSKPWYLMPTHFNCDVESTEDLVAQIDGALRYYPQNIHFEFVRHECAFHGTYSVNECETDFHIRLYQNTDQGYGHFVEFQRMDHQADRALFSQFYQTMQEVLLKGGVFNLPESEEEHYEEECYEEEPEETYNHGYDAQYSEQGHEDYYYDQSCAASALYGGQQYVGQSYVGQPYGYYNK